MESRSASLALDARRSARRCNCQTPRRTHPVATRIAKITKPMARRVTGASGGRLAHRKLRQRSRKDERRPGHSSAHAPAPNVETGAGCWLLVLAAGWRCLRSDTVVIPRYARNDTRLLPPAACRLPPAVLKQRHLLPK